METVITNVITGRPARAIANRLIREVGPLTALAPEFPQAVAAVMPLRTQAESQGSRDFSTLWAGQAFPLGRELTAGTLTRALADETLARPLRRRRSRAGRRQGLLRQCGRRYPVVARYRLLAAISGVADHRALSRSRYHGNLRRERFAPVREGLSTDRRILRKTPFLLSSRAKKALIDQVLGDHPGGSDCRRDRPRSTHAIFLGSFKPTSPMDASLRGPSSNCVLTTAEKRGRVRPWLRSPVVRRSDGSVDDRLPVDAGADGPRPADAPCSW